MKNKKIYTMLGFLIIGGLTACNGSIQLALPTATPVPVLEPEREEAPAPTPALELATEENRMLSLLELQSAYESIYDKVLPSVVSISVTQTISQALPFIPNLPFGAGSGFIWDTKGHIITNSHVVEGADVIRVVFSNGTSVLGKMIGADADSDLAVIKVDVPASLLKPIEVTDSTKVKVGQIAVAIGNPFQLSGSMTTGIISGTGRSLTLDAVDASGLSYSIPDVIQTDAAINPGNSGGVLVDIEGKLIGVTTAIESPVRANAGIGYVVPSIIVQKVVPVLIEKGSYEQPWIGISGTDLVPELAELMDLDTSQQGALVIEITSGSPADEAGLIGSAVEAQVDGREVRVGGDVIIGVNNQPINDFEDLVAFLARYALVGQTINLEVLREGEIVEIPLTLAARPGRQTSTLELLPEDINNDAWLGIQAVDLTPEITEVMDLDSEITGVLVQQVSAGSPADEVGIRGSYKPFSSEGDEILIGGDVITSFEEEAVDSNQSLAQALAQFNPGDEVRLSIIRDGESIELSVTLGKRPAN
ncbi:MAG TPA: trypsin-like peptidase domain-containing protein [Pelolinea sp.]|nr:trypsin-like peptidase domain-containing protein [Pelolinea sp.]